MSELLFMPVFIIVLSLLVFLLLFENYRYFKKLELEEKKVSNLIFELDDSSKENKKLKIEIKKSEEIIKDKEITIQANADLIKTLYMQKAELMKSLVSTDEILPTDNNQTTLFEALKH